MQEKINVFDENDALSGQTYYRRAKQLVAKGRAVWADSSKTAIRLTQKEMNSLKDYGTIESKLDSEELLYAAKHNVRLKRSLIYHTIAFLIAAPLVFAALPVFLNSAFTGDMTDITFADDEVMAATLYELRQMAFAFGQHNNMVAGRIVAQATNGLVNPSAVGATPASLYFAWGAYFAWGVFILSRFLLHLAPKIRYKEQKQVSAEYRRLMQGALDSNTVDLRKNA